MPLSCWLKSVITRLVGAFWLGGVVLSIALGVMEHYRTKELAVADHSQQLVVVAHNLQHVLRNMLPGDDATPLKRTLDIFREDPRLVAIRLTTSDSRTIVSGAFPQDRAALAVWPVTDAVGTAHSRLDLARQTLLVSPFTDAGRSHMLELVIDGPQIARSMRAYNIEQLSRVWLLLGVLALLGLLALRRWLAAPLQRIAGLSRRGASAGSFIAASDDMPHEFATLASAIGRMLHDLDATTHQLRERQEAFAHLYQFAPAALITVDPGGRVLEANHRAAQLFGSPSDAAVVGSNLLAAIRPEDRARFRQCLDRLDTHDAHSLDLRITRGSEARDVAAELAPIRDAAGDLVRIRLSLVDVTEPKSLLRQLDEQRRLLDLVINHMSDAILLVGADGRLVTANQRLAALLRVSVEDILGQPYHPGGLWSRLDLLNPEAFEQRMEQAMSQLDQQAQEQVETRDGSFLFNLVPVHDELRRTVGQLWVVQEVSAQLRSRRLLEQQENQLRALRRIGRRLQQVETVEELTLKVLGDLKSVFDVEAMGLALRSEQSRQRCRQLLWLDPVATHLADGRTLVTAVCDRLMPRVLPIRATSLFTDLSQHEQWAQPFVASGFEALAASALVSREKTQGVVWIARRGGRRIESYHLHLLEALAPLLATALENASLREQLRSHQLTDAVTDLPNRRLLPAMISRLVHRPGHPWSLMALDIDHFRRVNDTLGHEQANIILRRVADVLRDCCRAGDQIVRYDDDRFVIVCADTDLAGAAHFAQRLRSRVAAMEFPDVPAAPRLTCSIGVAGSPSDHDGSALTLEVAQRRLQLAKQAGRDRVQSADTPPAARAAQP